MFKIVPLLFILPLFLVINQYEAKPFLYNVASVLTSASGASSVPQNSENIADLRKSEKQVLRQETAPVEDNLNGFTFNEDPQTNNGFVPTLIQKKVSKILRKFLYINMFANSGNKPTTTTDEDFDREKEEFDREFEQDYGKNNSTSVNITGIHSVIDVVLPSNATEEISVHPNEIILFDENGIIEKRKEVQKIGDTNKKNDRIQDGGIFRFSPGDIGVFFTELLGSLVGLAYGAAAQFNRPGGQNQALI